ncbi:hypothetical protein JW796_04645 [Candidatus Dojkabacteria bacterium]|nr:hypothetical protein [Candidatus Dojkabacteria bacterium]
MNEYKILEIIIKTALVIATLFHLLVGLVVLHQTRSINRLVKTRPSGCVIGCTVFSILILLVVFLMVVFFF